MSRHFGSANHSSIVPPDDRLSPSRPNTRASSGAPSRVESNGISYRVRTGAVATRAIPPPRSTVLAVKALRDR